MALFDAITSEVAEKFGLGAGAGSLLTGLLKLITNEKSGGLGGFLDLFQNAGIGDLASSWVSRGSNLPLSLDQLTNALGGNTISQLAGAADVPAEKAKPALAYMIPQVIDLLTPNGTVPSSLPSTVLSYLTGGAGAALGAGAAAAAGGMHAATNLAGNAAGGDGSMLFKLLPLLALALLAFLGYKYCVDPGHQGPPATANANKPIATANANAPAKPKVDSNLAITVKDGKYIISGVVPDEATKADIIAKAKAAYGEGNFDVSGLKIDANAKAPEWLGKIGDAFAALKGAANGAVLSFSGAAVKLEGIAGAAATGLLDKLKGLFPAISLAAPINEAAVAEEAEKKAGDALAQLPANFTAQQLVDAMNLQIINFPSGKADIPKDREDILTRSADFIKKLPADAKIEVGGHTDNKGNAATNQALSAKRADAVKAFLVKAGANATALTAKGYGPADPVATNDTEEGRFKNRRIQFTIGK
jgi:outer membrane protein OmpA-like peptidoglycan-associated protein/uncharacterized protein YidB (DUF937 family)